MPPTIDTQPLTTARRSYIINIKGGERTASEWEELEKLSKDELIIELVKERQIRRQSYRIIRNAIDIDYPEDRRLPVYDDEGSDGESTSDEWARRIISYVWDHSEDRSRFDIEACQIYGLDSDQFDSVYSEMVSDGSIEDVSDSWREGPSDE